MVRPLLIASQLFIAVVLYPVVAVLGFWRFGDVGVTVEAVLIAAVLNFAFGFAFRWPSIALPAVLFPLWHLSTPDGCENCDVILDCGMYSLTFVALGAATRHLTQLARRRRAVERF
jgi:hypothetical protein